MVADATTVKAAYAAVPTTMTTYAWMAKADALLSAGNASPTGSDVSLKSKPAATTIAGVMGSVLTWW